MAKSNGHAHVAALANLEIAFASSVVGLAAKTLAGDLRDLMLESVKQQQKPWQQLSETEQASVISLFDWESKNVVKRIAAQIAAAGCATVTGQLDSVKLGKSLELKVLVSRSSVGRHDLIDAQAGDVLIAIPNVDRFMGERKPAKADPDAPELPIDLGEEAQDEARAQ
jgi:hypothetical protein